MEYLMTYGWAILIIAVVLGALFQLGIFNASTFTPKAPPGACHVFRPNGPGTASFINLQGICNGELPQYVAKFNGASSYVSATLTSQFANMKYATLCAWIFMAAASTTYPVIIAEQSSTAWNFNVNPNNYLYAQFRTAGGYNTLLGVTKIPVSQWTSVCATYDTNSKINTYVNGVADNSVTATFTGTLVAGTAAPTVGGGWTTYWFNGQIANVQVYNTSLSSNEIKALYNEGIGGAPVALNSLVAWWPLNGDAKDYSGNNNNGVPTALSFTSSWSSGYSAP